MPVLRAGTAFFPSFAFIMLSTLLFLAETTGAAVHGEAPGAITKIMQDFGLSVPLILAQVLSFSIVAIVLWKLAFKPVLATLDERQQKIQSGIDYAEEMKAKLDATHHESAELLKQAQTKAGAIINEARDTAKDFLDKQTQEATAKANDLIVKAQQAIELERRKTIAEAREEIARLVVATTERVLAKRLSDADRASYNETAAKELNVA